MYMNNQSLRSAGEKIEYTPKLMAEWARCKEDILYFAQKYFYIVSIDEGNILIPLRDYQKRMLKSFSVPPEEDEKRHRIVLSGRQSGKTQISVLFLLHYVLFNTDKLVAILANNERTASDILRKLKDSYEQLPLWLQQGVVEGGWSKTTIKLENKNLVISGSTSSNGIRGRTINLLFLDEFAFVPNNIADDFISSVYPTISSGETSRIIMVSTPKGMNHFYNVWTKAVKGENNFTPIKINWWEVPNRDDKWKEATIQDVGPIKWNQEFECKFLGSAATLVDPDLLERLGIAAEHPKELKFNGAMKIFERPLPDTFYVAGVDSAAGNGGDSSVIQVIKITGEHEFEQVAVFESNSVSYSKFAEVTIGISQYYNECYLMVENNDIGGQVANMIWHDYEYDKIINTDKKRIGTRATKTTKLAANMILKQYVENEWLKLKDEDTLRQLSMYEEVTPNVYRAPQSEHDDHVTSLIWAMYYITTPYFDFQGLERKRINNKYDIKKQEESYADMIPIFDAEDDLDEFGFPK